MKRFMQVSALLLLVLALAVPAMAAERRVYDDAGILSAGDVVALEKELKTVSETWGVEVMVITTDSTDGLSMVKYAESRFHHTDGVMLLVDMERREVDICPFGSGVVAFNGVGQDYMLDQFDWMLTDGDYADAFMEFASLCDDFLAQAATGEPYNEDNLPEEPFPWLFALIGSLIVGLVAALIVTGAMKGQLKSVRSRAAAEDYVVRDSLKLTHSSDLYLYSTVTQTPRPKNNSSSGGGGRSGGSRKF